MSKGGRAYDIAWDILIGYGNGDGFQTKGPLYDNPKGPDIVEDVVDNVISIMGNPND